jgi:hypothetical protein
MIAYSFGLILARTGCAAIGAKRIFCVSGLQQQA